MDTLPGPVGAPGPAAQSDTHAAALRIGELAHEISELRLALSAVLRTTSEHIQRLANPDPSVARGARLQSYSRDCALWAARELARTLAGVRRESPWLERILAAAAAKFTLDNHQ
jgi:hypothetical protein